MAALPPVPPPTPLTFPPGTSGPRRWARLCAGSGPRRRPHDTRLAWHRDRRSPGGRALVSWDLPQPAEREYAVTFQQMLKTLWTRKLTIVVSVVVCVVAALAYSKVSTPSYQSSALIQVSTPSQTGSTSSSTLTLPDPVQELGSTAVADAAAKNLHDPNPSSIAGLVTGSVDPTTGALTVTGTGSTPAGAEAVTQACLLYTSD